MRRTVIVRIPKCNLVHTGIEKDQMFHEYIQYLIYNKTLVHNKEYNFDYIIEEMRVSHDILMNEVIVELDIFIVKGECPTGEVTPLCLVRGVQE